MNKKLFEIREITDDWEICKIKIPIKKQWKIPMIIGICLLVIIIIGGIAIGKKSSFLKFHDKVQYIPLNEENKGFYGRVDAMLAEAVIEGNYTFEQLSNTENRMQFYIPDGSGEYLASLDEIRLMSFTPKDSTERQYYYNSHFKKYIELQHKYPNRKYFDIEWKTYERSKNNFSYRIKSIQIDKTLENVPLKNSGWKDKITLDDPFSKIDSQVVYIIKKNMPLPLFASNMTVNNFLNAVHKTDNVIDWDEWHKKTIDEMEKMYHDAGKGEDASPITIDFGNGMRVELVNIDGNIRLKPYNTILFIQNNSRVDTISRPSNNYVLSRFDNIVKLSVTNATGLTPSFNEVLYISNRVFKTASMLTNFGLGHRTSIDNFYSDLSVKQYINNITAIAKPNEKNIALSTNIFLSKILEQEMESYVNQIKKKSNTIFDKTDEWQMSMCLMDITSGEIIAAPFYSNKFQKDNLEEITESRNFNLERHHIGSTFKPLLAFAAAVKYPSLNKFKLNSINTHFRNLNEDEYPVILGYSVSRYGMGPNKKGVNSLFWKNFEIDRKKFLGISHNNYPIAMAMLALTENTENDRRAFNILNNNAFYNNNQVNNLHGLLDNIGTRIKYYPNNPVIDRILFQDGRIAESSFVNLIGNLYNVKTLLRDSVMWYSDSLAWRNMLAGGKPAALFPDNVNLRFDLTKNFIDFENMIIGQGNNFWTNIKLAEAYSRLLSKRKTEATFMKSDTAGLLFTNPNNLFNLYGTNYQFNRTRQEVNTVWNKFMNDWRIAVQMNGGTLDTAYMNFRQSFNNSQLVFGDYYFYCKTGTMENELKKIKRFVRNDRTGNMELKDGWWDEGIFVFGITNREKMPEGIVGVVYIRRITTKDPHNVGGISSETAMNFLNCERFRKIMFYNKNRFKTQRR